MTSTVPADYSERILSLRDQLGLTQTDLAERLGVSFATVNRWENGHNKPSHKCWARIIELSQHGLQEEPKPEDSAPLPEGASVPIRTFDADPHAVRAVVEGERLMAGHRYNPSFAVEVARIEPLPHQRIAVYEHMLKQPRLRFLLADDAGAGKTIMSGLYMREMLARRLVRRILVVPPAGLVGNWYREMRDLFGLHFRILRGADAKPNNPFTGPNSDLIIVSVDTLRQPRMVERLQETDTPYDLVVFDEAHKLSVHQRADGTVEATERYKLAEALAGVRSVDEAWQLNWSARHLLLLSATPHMGKSYPYFGLWRLLEPEVFATEDAFNKYPTEAKRRYFLRRTKEEMVYYDGRHIFPPRRPETLTFDLSPREQKLYEDVTRYMRVQYNRAKFLNRSAAQLAMSVFQRRLASSTFALARSLERRIEKLQGLINAIRNGDITEEELRRRQERLNREVEDDYFEQHTADEEEVDGDGETHEAFEDKALGGVIARNLIELEAEQEEVEGLLRQARDVLAEGNDAKFTRLLQEIQKPAYQKEKLLIFTEHRDTLEYIVGRLESLGYTGQVAQIHGGMDYAARDEAVVRFRTPVDKGGAQFLVGTDAAGEGINLQFCWRMVNYDIPWNPARLEQRMGRIHRFGQRHEFVSIRNLVAVNTREGRVLKTLMDKLDEIRHALSSEKVFDVIGHIFDGRSVKDYMLRFIEEEEDEDSVVAELEQRITKEHVEEIIRREQERYGTSDEIKRRLPELRAQLERERFQRLLPGYLLRYLREAAPLVGLKLVERDDTTFSFRVLEKGALDPLLPVLNTYPPHLHDRLTTYRPGPDDDAIWLRPGEPLFEAFQAYVHARFAEAARRGAVFVDPGAKRPYYLHIGSVTVEREADPSLPGLHQAEVLEHQLVAFSEEAGGEMVEVPLEHTLLLRGLSREEVPVSMQHLIPAAGASIGRAERKLRERAAARATEQRGFRMRTLEEREMQLRKGFDLQMAELAATRSKLRRKIGNGKGSRAALDRVKAQQRILHAHREEALQRLHREIELIQPGEVEFLAHLLVLPSGDPEERQRFDAEVEARAMHAAMHFERQRGARVFDVSTPERARAMGLPDWPGFDLLSEHPATGETRAIEVKGRASSGDVQMTENEWYKALNVGPGYWLYVVYHCATVKPYVLPIQDPFTKFRDRVRVNICIPETDILRCADAEG